MAAIIGLAIEVVYLRDNFQMRMNTLFKFYYQIWILWALAAGYAFWRVLYAAFGTRSEPAMVRGAYDRYGRYYERVSRASSGHCHEKPGGVVGGHIRAACTVGLDVFVVRRANAAGAWAERFGGPGWHHLDGERPACKRPGPPAANWLKQNATGKDVVLEAGAAEYDWTGRISSFSGRSHSAETGITRTKGSGTPTSLMPHSKLPSGAMWSTRFIAVLIPTGGAPLTAATST